MTDIIDEIDALVDEQLSGYSDRSGYDHNVNQDRCGHCHREWHGLKITERMESMAMQVAYDEDYRYADDDSDVLCPGSSFIGPWATKWQIERMRAGTAQITISVDSYNFVESIQRATSAIRRFADSYAQGGEVRSNPDLQMRAPGDPMIESAEWAPYSLAALHRMRDYRYAYAFPQRVILGIDGSADEIRGAEASQVIFDEGRPYRYGEDFSFVGPTIRPEMQYPRELRYGAGSWSRMQDMINQLRGLGVLDEPVTMRRWLTGDPEPDTRTPQERALPRPSTTPPMWAVDAGRQRRTRTNSRRRHR
ncbi:hypothetical protein O4214_30150 [Rhodococcus erythropolis]|nr:MULTISPECIES: hypothetical protein [Rhodococcus erythropolis group]MCD2109328.1 hypothetical protein [Rhodococcus qingshengii]MCZ4528253.1 hypothetical protein [Rhodococcus erythropolis]